MKRLISILFLAATGSVSFAQDTAYISRDKTTALFFNGPVKIVGSNSPSFMATQIESGIITLKAVNINTKTLDFDVREESSGRVYHIPVLYSYGRAGRRIDIRSTGRIMTLERLPEFNFIVVTNKIASGKREHVVDHEKSGGVKVWVSKLSLAGNNIFFRLDIRNRSNLPYNVDFVRFYIRDLKTVERMATHEREILPVYSTLNKKTTVSKTKELTAVFAFRRFSLSEDQALNIELYERNGNRHLYLRVGQKDLENLKTITPAPQQPDNTLAAITSN